MSDSKPAKRCPRAGSCEPFLMFGLRASAELWEQYCDGDFERCARYRHAAACGAVPENLLPNGRKLGVALI